MPLPLFSQVGSRAAWSVMTGIGYHADAQLLGVSTVFGNQRLECVTTNACIVLHSAGLHAGMH